MLSNLAVVALAAAGAVNAGPLQRRQATSAVESASSIASEASSAASSAVSSVVSGASSTAASGSSEASAATSTAASSAESSAAAATSTAAAGAGNYTNLAYPCPPGFLLTYVELNQTVPMMVTQVTPAVGEWASSPLFPNVTMPMGGNDPGATHTINVGEIALPEVLVSYVANDTSGSAIWTWNGSLPEPVTAMGVTLASYSTVLQVYDPDYTTTGSIGNTTFINLFTNACAMPQAEAMQLLMTLGGLELSNAAAALSGNSTMPAASSTAADSAASSSMMSSTMMESSMASMESSMMSASTAASSAASSVASSAESAVSSAASSAASAGSSAVAAATSTSA